MLHFSPIKTASILLTLFIGLWLALPNLLPQAVVDMTPSWLPHRTLTLGLDLQGGGQFLLEIDKNTVLHDQVTTLKDRARQVLADAKIGNTGSVQGRTALISLRNTADTAKALDLLKPLGIGDSASLFGVSDRAADVASPTDGKVALTMTDEGIRDRLNKIMSRAIEIVGNRVNGLGTTEPVIQRQGDDRILLQLPGLKSSANIATLLNQTAKLEFRLVDLSMTAEQAEQSGVPADSELLPAAKGSGSYLVEQRVIVSGEDLVDAQSTFDSQNHEPVISFRFNATGAKAFARVSTESVGKPFAIVLDGKVLSAPVIREPITGGNGQISGDFTTESANNLALLLRSGALPAPMKIVEERTVGPGLGQDSIRAGEMAALVGSILVIGFMIASYGLFGIIASVAVALNVGLIFGVLSLLGATLTLPGIAGIVLTVGIAVDSNVLIYERIREEVRAGRSVLMALDAGFSRALATILDSNITTFIASAVLFFVGTGAVKGFAVTLGIGIITTVFTAFTVTRLMVSWWYRGLRPRTIPI